MNLELARCRKPQGAAERLRASAVDGSSTNNQEIALWLKKI
jgi:hypothetical protein